MWKRIKRALCAHRHLVLLRAHKLSEQGVFDRADAIVADKANLLVFLRCKKCGAYVTPTSADPMEPVDFLTQQEARDERAALAKTKAQFLLSKDEADLLCLSPAIISNNLPKDAKPVYREHSFNKFPYTP